jgi:hypothetical protein
MNQKLNNIQFLRRKAKKQSKRRRLHMNSLK